MKDQQLKKIRSWLALAGLFATVKMSAVSFSDIQFWTGTGTNRAALVIEWSPPESFGGSTVPAPIADQSLVWGYRFNGTPSATQMLTDILAADPRLYVVIDESLGTYVDALGYNLANGVSTGITDGSQTNFLQKNFLTTPTVAIDASAPLNPADLYWAGAAGPNWEVWTESGGAGGFSNCPDRGSDLYWTPDDITAPWSGTHGQWELAQAGLDTLTLTNGSWIGFSVAAGELFYGVTPNSAPFFAHKHAPKQPQPDVTALVKNYSGGFDSEHWQAHFISCTNWNYTLERSADLQHWITVTNGVPGNTARLNLADPAPVADKVFYRVRADLQ